MRVFVITFTFLTWTSLAAGEENLTLCCVTYQAIGEGTVSRHQNSQSSVVLLTIIQTRREKLAGLDKKPKTYT
jgi:hypothetical protein